MLTVHLENNVCNCIFQAADAPVFITSLNINNILYQKQSSSIRHKNPLMKKHS